MLSGDVREGQGLLAAGGDGRIAFLAGAAEIALRAGAEIVPIAIDCHPQMLGKNVPWYRIPPSQPRLR